MWFWFEKFVRIMICICGVCFFSFFVVLILFRIGIDKFINIIWGFRDVVSFKVFFLLEVFFIIFKLGCVCKKKISFFWMIWWLFVIKIFIFMCVFFCYERGIDIFIIVLFFILFVIDRFLFNLFICFCMVFNLSVGNFVEGLYINLLLLFWIFIIICFLFIFMFKCIFVVFVCFW